MYVIKKNAAPARVCEVGGGESSRGSDTSRSIWRETPGLYHACLPGAARGNYREIPINANQSCEGAEPSRARAPLTVTCHSCWGLMGTGLKVGPEAGWREQGVT